MPEYTIKPALKFNVRQIPGGEITEATAEISVNVLGRNETEARRKFYETLCEIVATEQDLENHRGDVNPHYNAFRAHNDGPTEHQKAFEAHNKDPGAHTDAFRQFVERRLAGIIRTVLTENNYVTKTDVETIVQSQIANLALKDHNHDDTYAKKRHRHGSGPLPDDS